MDRDYSEYRDSRVSPYPDLTHPGRGMGSVFTGHMRWNNANNQRSKSLDRYQPKHALPNSAPATPRDRRGRERDRSYQAHYSNWKNFGHNWKSSSITWDLGDADLSARRDPGGFFHQQNAYIPALDTNHAIKTSIADTKSEKTAPSMYASLPDEDITQRDVPTKKTVHDIFKRFSLRTSLQGVAYVRDAGRWWTRVMWIFLMVAALSMAVFQLHGVIHTYILRPINTRINLQRKNSIEFPSITFCNINPIRLQTIGQSTDLYRYHQQISELWDDDILPQYLNTVSRSNKRKKRDLYDNKVVQVFDNSTDYFYYIYDGNTAPQSNVPSSDNSATVSETRDDFGYGITSTDTMIYTNLWSIIGSIPRSLRQDMGHQLDDMILSCSYNGRQCNSANFSASLNKDYGNCYTFNSKFLRVHPVKTKFSGSLFGLNLLLHTQQAQYLTPFTTGNGFRVVVHPFDTMPFPVENGLSIYPGQETFIGIKHRSVTRLGEPYGKCSKDASFRQLYDFKYTTDTCFNTCKQREIGGVCGCYIPFDYERFTIEQRHKTQPCSTAKQIQCAETVGARVLSGKIPCVCSNACSEKIYDTDVSSNSWPDKRMWATLVNTICAKDVNSSSCAYLVSFANASEETRDWVLKNNFQYLRIFFKDLTYEDIIQEPEYGDWQFYSDIGGAVGLWLGISVFSFVEVITLLVDLCKYLYKKGQCKENKKTINATSRKSYIPDFTAA